MTCQFRRMAKSWLLAKFYRISDGGAITPRPHGGVDAGKNLDGPLGKVWFRDGASSERREVLSAIDLRSSRVKGVDVPFHVRGQASCLAESTTEGPGELGANLLSALTGREPERHLGDFHA